MRRFNSAGCVAVAATLTLFCAQGAAAQNGKSLQLPKTKREVAQGKDRNLVLPKAKQRQSPQPGKPSQKSKKSPFSEPLSNFMASLASKERLGTEELIAEYTLLSDADKDLLRRQVRKLEAGSLGRLALVYRELNELRALPLLLARLRTGKVGRFGPTVVACVIDLAGKRGTKLALELLNNRFKAIRTSAQDVLRERLTEQDLGAIQTMLDSHQQGTRVAAIKVLGEWTRVHPAASVQALVDCLWHRDGIVRTQAARFLADEGPRAVQALLPLVKSGSTREGFYLAAWLLARQELLQGKELLPSSCLSTLARTFQAGEPLERNVATLVAAVRYFADTKLFRTKNGALGILDPKVVFEELLRIIDVKRFYPEFAICHEGAMTMLRLLSGRDFGTDETMWATWWKENADHLTVYRRGLPLSVIAIQRMRLEYRIHGKLQFAVLGPDADGPKADEHGVRVRLTSEAMLECVNDLKTRGLLNVEARMTRDTLLPEDRSLILTSRDGQSRDAFTSDKEPRLRSLLVSLDRVLEHEEWQEFVPTQLGPSERRAWWAKQNTALEALKTQRERHSYVLELCTAAITDLDDAARKRAIGVLMAEARRRDSQLTRRHADKLFALLETPKLAKDDARAVLEVASMIKAPGVFERVLDALAKIGEFEIRRMLPRVVQLAGRDKILTALASDNDVIREVAAAQSGRLKYAESYPAVIKLLDDKVADVRAAAASSCGRLRLAEATAKVEALCKDPDGGVRRAALFSLGALGGPNVYKILHAATASAEIGERMAAVRGLSLLRDIKAAKALVRLTSTHFPGPIGLLALDGLRERGGPELRAEVRQAYRLAEDEKLKREYMYLLGEMQDPATFTKILEFASRGIRVKQSCEILASISGFDYCDDADYVAKYAAWWQAHRGESPERWLLQALAAAEIQTTLRYEDMLPGAPARVIDELCRIVEEGKTWPIRALAAYSLREITGQDYGTVNKQTSHGAISALAENYRAWARARSAVSRDGK